MLSLREPLSSIHEPRDGLDQHALPTFLSEPNTRVCPSGTFALYLLVINLLTEDKIHVVYFSLHPLIRFSEQDVGRPMSHG